MKYVIAIGVVLSLLLYTFYTGKDYGRKDCEAKAAAEAQSQYQKFAAAQESLILQVDAANDKANSQARDHEQKLAAMRRSMQTLQEEYRAYRDSVGGPTCVLDERMRQQWNCGNAGRADCAGHRDTSEPDRTVSGPAVVVTIRRPGGEPPAGGTDVP